MAETPTLKKKNGWLTHLETSFAIADFSQGAEAGITLLLLTRTDRVMASRQWAFPQSTKFGSTVTMGPMVLAIKIKFPGKPWLLPCHTMPKIDKGGLYYQKWTGKLYISLDHLDHLGGWTGEFGPTISSETNWRDAKNNLDNLEGLWTSENYQVCSCPKLPSTWASAASEPYQPKIVALFGNFFWVKPLGMFHTLCKSMVAGKSPNFPIEFGDFPASHVWFPKGEHISQAYSKMLAEFCPRMRSVMGICSVPITCDVRVNVKTSWAKLSEAECEMWVTW